MNPFCKRFLLRNLSQMAPEDLINAVVVAMERMSHGNTGRKLWEMSGQIVPAVPPMRGYRFRATSDGGRDMTPSSFDGPSLKSWNGVVTLDCLAAVGDGENAAFATLTMEFSDSQFWYTNGADLIIHVTLLRIERYLIEVGRADTNIFFEPVQGALKLKFHSSDVRAIILNTYGAGDDWQPPARPAIRGALAPLGSGAFVPSIIPALTSWGGREELFDAPALWFQRNIRAICRSAGFEQVEVSESSNQAFGAIQRQGPGPLNVRYALVVEWSGEPGNANSSRVLWRVLNDAYSPGMPNAELAEKLFQQIDLAVRRRTPPAAGARIVLGPGEQLPDEFLDYADQYDCGSMKDYSGLTTESEAAALLREGPLTLGFFARFGFNRSEPQAGQRLGWGSEATATTAVFGLGGSGKTGLLAHWARQANAAGWDVLVLDPAGALSAQLPMNDFYGPAWRFVSDATEPTGPRPDFMAMIRDVDGPDEIAAAALAEALLPLSSPALTAADLNLHRRRLAALVLLVETRFLHQPDSVAAEWPTLADVDALLHDERVLAEAIQSARSVVPPGGPHRRILDQAVARLVDLIGPEFLPDEGRRAAKDRFNEMVLPLFDALSPFGSHRSLFRRSGPIVGLSEFERVALPVGMLFQTRPAETSLFPHLWALALANLRHLLHRRARRIGETRKKLLILIDEAHRIPGLVPAELVQLVRDGAAHCALALNEPRDLALDEAAVRSIMGRLSGAIFLRRVPAAAYEAAASLLGGRTRRALTWESATGAVNGGRRWQLRDVDGPYFTKADLEPLPGQWPALTIWNADRPRPLLTELARIASAEPPQADMPLQIAYEGYRSIHDRTPPSRLDLAAATVSANGSSGFRTITAALARARPNATITIHPGVYAEDVFISRPVRLIATEPDAVVIAGSGCPLTVQSAGVEISDLVLRGAPIAARVDGVLTMEGCRVEDGDIEVNRRGALLRMTACSIEGGALRLSPGTHATFSHGSIEGARFEGVSMTDAVMEMRDSIISRCGKCGVSIAGGAVTMRGCAVIESRYGFIFSHRSEATLRNCRIEASQNSYSLDEGGVMIWYDTQIAADLSKPVDAM